MTGRARRAPAVLGALALALAIAASAACSEETIVLATIPSADEEAGVPAIPTRCATRDDCARDAFCEKPACDAPFGVCRRAPAICPQEERPVCGCDGVTYWNDCLRMASGVAAAEVGECDTRARRCHAAEACPDGATCAFLLPPDRVDLPCVPSVLGVCWVLPAACPPPVGPDRWVPCEAAPRCVTTCEAIRASVPFRRAGRCP